MESMRFDELLQVLPGTAIGWGLSVEPNFYASGEGVTRETGNQNLAQTAHESSKILFVLNRMLMAVRLCSGWKPLEAAASNTSVALLLALYIAT